jgi:hypothetical protein
MYRYINFKNYFWKKENFTKKIYEKNSPDGEKFSQNKNKNLIHYEKNSIIGPTMVHTIVP